MLFVENSKHLLAGLALNLDRICSTTICFYWPFLARGHCPHTYHLLDIRDVWCDNQRDIRKCEIESPMAECERMAIEIVDENY